MCYMIVREDGMTIIVATYEMGSAKSEADMILFMDQGEIFETAEPGKFFTKPDSERTQLFLSKILTH